MPITTPPIPSPASPETLSTQDRPRDWLRSIPRRLRGHGGARGALLLLAAALIAGLAVLGGGMVQADSVPGEVTNLRLSSDTPGALTITWDAPSSAPADYRIAWARDDLSWLSWNASNETHRGSSYPGGADTSLTLTGLTGGETYKVRMRSRYNPGTSDGWSGPWTGEVTQRVTDDPPAAPTSLTTSQVTYDSVTLSWTAPSRGTITGYSILRGADANSLTAIVADTGSTSTQYTDSSVAAETTYVYGLQALSPDGDGAQSETTTVTTTAPPPPPTPVHASDEVTSLTLDSSAGGELVIEWNTPTDEPNDYRISWAPADEDYLSYSEDNTDRRGNSYPDGDATSLTLTNLPGGVTYKTMMRARYHNEATQEYSSGPWTAEVTQQIQNNPPEIPAGLRTLATDQEITLEWDDPADDSITGYEIWRGPDASNLEVLAADTGSAANSYLDDAVTPETTYHYAINAINAAGAGQQSDTISATTQAPPKLQQQGRRHHRKAADGHNPPRGQQHRASFRHRLDWRHRRGIRDILHHGRRNWRIPAQRSASEHEQAIRRRRHRGHIRRQL